MATKVQHAKRQQAAREARAQALAAARKRDLLRKRLLVGIGGAVVIAVVVAGIVVLTGGKDKTTALDTTGTTIDAASPTPTVAPSGAGSVAGKPCVAVADPLPTGSPPVPVHVGAPPTALITEDIKPGTGAVVAATDSLSVNYIGVSCSTGKIFDSSYSRGKPFPLKLDSVIKGWQEGIPGMKVGGQRLLGIPGDLAYGAQGRPPTIAPDETLWFVIEMVSATPAA